MARRLLPIIDFAHGSDVAGKQSPDGRHKEYLWSRKVGKMLAESLKHEGFEVAFTNTKDTEIGLSRRKEIANNLDTPRGELNFCSHFITMPQAWEMNGVLPEDLKYIPPRDKLVQIYLPR